jgi:hypothetical protein
VSDHQPQRDYASDGVDGREQIHLPGQTAVPLVTALAITVALVGLVLSWWFVAAGGALFLIAVSRWIRDVREDIESLPTERR